MHKNDDEKDDYVLGQLSSPWVLIKSFFSLVTTSCELLADEETFWQQENVFRD